MSAKDQNDKLRDGTLPKDPQEASEPFSPDSGVRKAALRVVGANDAASLPDPSDIYAEHALLGCLLWCGANSPDSVTLAKVADLVGASEMFYSRPHGFIFDAMLAIVAKGGAIDVVSVHGELVRARKERAAGGIEYLEKLEASADTVSEQKARTYAGAIRDAFTRRHLIAAARRIEADARSGKMGAVEAAGAAMEATRIAAETVAGESGVTRISQAVAGVYRDLVSGVKAECSSTGLREFDDAMDGGLYPRETSILGAWTSVGKSALAATMALNLVRSDPKAAVMYVTLEMSASQFTRRIISSTARVNSRRIRRRTLNPTEHSQVAAAASEIGKLHVYFVDVMPQTILSIHERATKLRRKLSGDGVSLRLIVIDLVTQVKATQIAQKKGNREQEVAEISRGLRFLANENHCHVLGTAHLSRDGQKRTGKARLPKTYDLRESAMLANDANNVFLLHRDVDEREQFIPNQPAALIIPKQRDGEKAMVLLKVEPEFVQFSDWDGERDGWF